MKYKVIGWTADDDSYPTTCTRASFAVRNAIKREIKEKGYKFTGEEHQDRSFGSPVLNNGIKYSFSRRGWGALMAEVWCKDDPFSYALYSDMIKPSKLIPNTGFDDRNFVPSELLHETISVEVDEKLLNLFINTDQIELFSNCHKEIIEELQFLDAGDTLLFKCNKKLFYKVIEEVIYESSATENDRIEFNKNYVMSSDENSKKAALEKWQKIPNVLKIKTVKK